jgi:ATP-dependent Clp protease ATP-binding subunit ClpA
VSSPSPALLLAWDIAANEAANARQQYIEPEHLFIGLCKLDDFTSATSLVELGYEQSEAEEMQPEIELLIALFYRLGLNPVHLRREMRQRKTTGVLKVLSGWTTGILRPANRPSNGVIHRSAASRVLFSRADEFALMTGSRTTTIIHLLAAMLDDPQGSVNLWLQKQGVDVNAVKEAALEVKPLPKRR